MDSRVRGNDKRRVEWIPAFAGMTNRAGMIIRVLSFLTVPLSFPKISERSGEIYREASYYGIDSRLRGNDRERKLLFLTRYCHS